VGLTSLPAHPYSVSADGQRFLFSLPIENRANKPCGL
jgi:hypothetical protein